MCVGGVCVYLNVCIALVRSYVCLGCVCVCGGGGVWVGMTLSNLAL